MHIGIIARLTFREAVRRKIAITAILLGFAFLILFNLGYYFITAQVRTMTSQMPPLAEKSFYNSFLLAGLYAANFLSIAMAALVSADTLAGEINSGTVQAVATKPLRRMEIVLGKWIGYAVLLALYMLPLTGGLILGAYLQSAYLPPRPLAGIALMYMGSLVMMTVTIAFSSSMSTLATGGAVFGLYGLAFVGSWVEQIGSVINNQTAVQIGIISSLLMPSEALWRRASFEMTTALVQLMAGGPFTARSVPSVWMIAYGGMYMVAALLIGLRRFTKRDL